MYQLIRQSGKIADREFVIEFLSSGWTRTIYIRIGLA